MPMPVIWKREPSSDWMVATVSTSPLPFSNSTTAIGFLMLARETSRSDRPPASLRLTATAGCWFSSKVAAAPVSCWPVKIASFLSTTGAPRPWRNSSLPNGTGPLPEHRLLGLGGQVDQPGFERGGAAEDVLGAGRVLHARQLHHDPVEALALDHRLGHAELVDPVVQRGDVLLQRTVEEGAHRGFGQGGDQLQVGAAALLGQRQVRLVAGAATSSRRAGASPRRGS